MNPINRYSTLDEPNKAPTFSKDYRIDAKPVKEVDFDDIFNGLNPDNCRVILAPNLVYANPALLAEVGPFLRVAAHGSYVSYDDAKAPVEPTDKGFHFGLFWGLYDLNTPQSENLQRKAANILNSQTMRPAVSPSKPPNGVTKFSPYVNIDDTPDTQVSFVQNGVCFVRDGLGVPARYLLDSFRQRNESFVLSLVQNTQLATTLPLYVTAVTNVPPHQHGIGSFYSGYPPYQTASSVPILGGLDELQSAGIKFCGSKDQTLSIVIKPGLNAPYIMREQLTSLLSTVNGDVAVNYSYTKNDYFLALTQNLQRNNPDSDPIEFASFVKIDDADVGLPTRPLQYACDLNASIVYGDDRTARATDYRWTSFRDGTVRYYDPKYQTLKTTKEALSIDPFTPETYKRGTHAYLANSIQAGLVSNSNSTMASEYDF